MTFTMKRTRLGTVSATLLMLLGGCFDDSVRLYVEVDDSCAVCCDDQSFRIYVGGYEEQSLLPGEEALITRETGTGNEVLEVWIIDRGANPDSTPLTCRECIQSPISDPGDRLNEDGIYALYDDNISFVDDDLHAQIHCEIDERCVDAECGVIDGKDCGSCEETEICDETVHRCQDNTEPGSLVTLAPMLTPRSSIGLAAVDGKLYAAGGWRPDNETNHADTYNEMEAFDLETRTWTAMTPIPNAKSGFGTAAWDKKIYTFGGCTSRGCTTDYNRVQIYDTVTDTWGAGEPMPVKGRACAVTVGDAIYVVALGRLYRYDPALNTWERLSTVPGERSFVSLAAIDNTLYLIGYDADDDRKMVSYDLDGDAWTERARCIEGRSVDPVLVAVDAALYLFGMDKGIERYDATADRWERLTNEGKRYHGAAVASNGWIYLVGGFAGSPKDVTRYVPPL